jgi:hypothetical protein
MRKANFNHGPECPKRQGTGDKCTCGYDAQHNAANLHNALREAVMARHAWDRALSELGEAARVIDMPDYTRSKALQRITNYVCHVAHETEDARDVDADMAAHLRAELDKIAKGE